MLQVRKSDGTEVEYDSRMFSFRVMNAKLQIIYKNTTKIYYEYENGVWASALETPYKEQSKTV